ncbi:MAG: GAF domain-containing protein [bacterium]|nr:GAF domain-containing protein [bacterium]
MRLSTRLIQFETLLQKHEGLNERVLRAFSSIHKEIGELERQVDILIEAGGDLNKTMKDRRQGMEIILSTARKLTNADGGTLYMVDLEYYDEPLNPGELKAKYLNFEVLQNDSMNVYRQRTEAGEFFLPPVPLEVQGVQNVNNVSAYCANTGQVINIPDVYNAQGFDFSGTKKYDEQTGYRSKSMLVIPLRDHENEIIGVLQLINRKDKDGEVIPFAASDQAVVQAISYQAAVSLTTDRLVSEQERLFAAFVQVLAEGLGEKSPYNFGHINRVASLTYEIAEMVSKHPEGMYGPMMFTEDQMEEIRLSGWMHDIGKLTTPESVVSKQLKMEVLVDRFDMLVQRYNSKIKDLEIDFLQAKVKALETGTNPDELKELEGTKNEQVKELVGELQQLLQFNFGGEFMADEKIAQIEAAATRSHRQFLKSTTAQGINVDYIAQVELLAQPSPEALVDEKEKELLSIRKGTLSDAERKIINDHADRSWRWLFKLPFPRKMLKLPLYAAAHHETLNGTGYPHKLKANQLPLQSRIIAVVDIFEALTASDRPYKQPMPLSKALEILGFMVKDGHLDPEVIRIFLKSGLCLDWAQRNLLETQLGPVDVDAWLERFYPKGFEANLPAYQEQLLAQFARALESQA